MTLSDGTSSSRESTQETPGVLLGAVNKLHDREALDAPTRLPDAMIETATDPEQVVIQCDTLAKSTLMFQLAKSTLMFPLDIGTGHAPQAVVDQAAKTRPISELMHEVSQHFTSPAPLNAPVSTILLLLCQSRTIICRHLCRGRQSGDRVKALLEVTFQDALSVSAHHSETRDSRPVSD